MKKSGPKLNKALQSLAKKYDKSPAVTEPETAEVFIEEGALDEESGDRWYSSDLAKGLRFYQKAYEKYLKAIELASSVSDQKSVQGLAYYNASRLLFHVYSQYHKADGVSIADLTNIAEVLDARCRSVVQDIQEIVRAHETAIEFFQQDAPTDLLFNAAMVYTDVIEDSESSLDISYLAQMSVNLFEEVLRRQAEELEKIGPSGFSKDPAETGAAQETQDASTSPSDVLETIISILNLAQSVLEAAGTSNKELDDATSLVAPFLNEADHYYAFLAISEYTLHEDQKAEFFLAKASAIAACMKSLDEILPLWEDDDLPESAEKSMIAADSIDSFLFRTEISSSATANPESYWAALTKMNLHFKTAQEALTERLQLAKTVGNANQQMGLGSIISQIAKVAIARSDIDLQRSQLPLEQAQKNSTVLLNNSKAFLKNALNLAKQSGGIREKAIEKNQREKRRIEAVCRLCVLEEKTSVSELDSIVGAGRWQSELEILRDLWYFPKGV